MILKKSTFPDLTEKKLDSKIIHEDENFAFISDKVKLPDGNTIIRNYIHYPEAVAIIPFIDAENIVMVKQFRYPINKTTLEIPAGKIKTSEETKIEAAYRELLEETGFTSTKFFHLISFYPCPGYSSEIIHIYKAIELKFEEQKLDFDEFIETEVVPINKALQMIFSGEIIDSKTIIALLYYQFQSKPENLKINI